MTYLLWYVLAYAAGWCSSYAYERLADALEWR